MLAMAELDPIAEMTVEAFLTRWPETAEVFNRHNMACVGCPVAPFYTVTEAAEVYNLSPAEFIEELKQAMDGNQTGE